MNEHTVDRRPAVIPFMCEASIERRAMQLLAEFGRKRQPVTAPPIPIDDIAELHLGLRLEIIELQDDLRAPGVLGALWADERRVAIDASLDPERHPALEGRYRFTLAHEVAHWRLHRSAPGLTRFELASNLPDVGDVDRALHRLEYQANLFASALLMPRLMVRAVWREVRGGDAPFCASSYGDRFYRLRELLASSVRPRDPNAAEDLIFERVSKPLAMRFRVSTEAMRIRLERLGLLIRVPTDVPGP